MTTVTPEVGCYLVRLVGPEGIRAHLVGKDKHCSCGGNPKRWCSHMRAVVAYLKAGGERAPEAAGDGSLRDSRPAVPQGGGPIPEDCPICGAGVSALGLDAWRCRDDPAHYYQWRGERNGGAIRKFLTQPHPAKQGAYYAMSAEEREEFLARALRRMHVGGYTPHS